jgi:hypothetical protein
MSTWQSIALSFLIVALNGLQSAIKNPLSKLRYRSYCLAVFQASKVIASQFPDDPDFQ